MIMFDNAEISNVEYCVGKLFEFYFQTSIDIPFNFEDILVLNKKFYTEILVAAICQHSTSCTNSSSYPY